MLAHTGVRRQYHEAEDNNVQGLPSLTEEDIDDLDDAPDAEVEETEEIVVDQATAARTIAELQAEIEILKNLEALALRVRRSGTDKKWEDSVTNSYRSKKTLPPNPLNRMVCGGEFLRRGLPPPCGSPARTRYSSEPGQRGPCDEKN